MFPVGSLIRFASSEVYSFSIISKGGSNNTGEAGLDNPPISNGYQEKASSSIIVGLVLICRALIAKKT